MYSVSSDGSCGFVTEQSKPLGSKKRATVAFGILEFLLFVHRLYMFVSRVPLVPLVPCATCRAKFAKLKTCRKLLWHFWIQSCKVNSGRFHEFSRKKSTTQRFLNFWHTFFQGIQLKSLMRYQKTSQTYQSPCFFSAAVSQ